ncbi:MAG: LysM peptidoglycan-binding domain-containing protein [Bacteroidota bacterium]
MKTAPAHTALWCALAGLLACAGSGCGKPVLRVADASLGDYYSDQEFRKLNKEQREEYCNDLANQDSLYLDDIREGAAELADAQARRGGLARAADSLLAEAQAREQNIRTLLAARGAGGGRGRGGQSAHPAAARYNVRPGDSLWRISKSESVYGEGAEWRRIYESNRGAVKDPDLIYPGQELSIPR